MASPRRSSGRLLALQHRDFRLLWLAVVTATVGLHMQTIAANWHVYALLRDAAPTLTLFGRTVELNAGALGLGGLGLVRWAPLLIFALAGGILADTRNRRKLLMATYAASLLLALLLALLTFSGKVSLLAIYAIIAGLTALQAIEYPARESLLPNLVPRDHLTNAVSLTAMTNVIGAITGPALSGLLLDRGQIAAVYALHSASYLPALAALALIRYSGAVRQGVRLTRADLAEGFRFTFRTHMIRSTMLLDFFATLLGSARTLLPIVADQGLGIGAGGYGFLATAQPLGSLLAGTLVSLRRDIYRQGLIFLVCIGAYGLGTAFFGLSTVFALSYVLFAITGAADTISSIIRGAIRQLWTPDNLRGRMVGVNMIFYMGGPQLGEVRAGLVAALLGAPAAIVSGGLMAASLALWVGWRDRRLRRYTSADMPVAAGG
ncbi:MAG TPA: MFS transporter [Caldilineaceae bacterium]|nr:MFS transporter [Caldilineaceae bacterium]